MIKYLVEVDLHLAVKLQSKLINYLNDTISRLNCKKKIEDEIENQNFIYATASYLYTIK